VFVKVNGEPRPTRSLDSDWARFEIESKDGEETIATVLKDSETRGVLVVSGSPTEEDIKRLRQTDTESERAIGLEGVGSIDLRSDADIESMIEALAEIDFSDSIPADIMREIELSFADGQSPFSGLRSEPLGTPKSMIGITMSIEFVDDEQTVVVEEVMEGMPAAKAGLRTGDRIVEIESIGKADAQAVRQLIREREPGDKVTLRILRDGDEIEKIIELAPYQNRVSGLIEQSGGGAGQRFFTFEPDAARLAEAQAAAERLRSELAERRAEIERLTERLANGADPGQIVEQLREASRRLVESERRLSEQTLREELDMGLAQRLRGEDGGGVIVGRVQRGERPLMLTIPGRPPAPSVPSRIGGETERGAAEGRTAERVDELEARLDRLEESNERIERMLQTLMEQLAQRD